MNVVDKTRLTVGGRALLDRVVDALAGATRVVVVGDERPTARAVQWTREDPVGSGPAAALAAALEQVSAPYVAVLAADLPFLRRADVEALVDAIAGATADGAVLVDGEGQRQWLCSAWRVSALRTADLRPDAALRKALGDLAFVELIAPADGRAVLDCDTPEDLRRAEELT
jgi:molybdopterin-guanine dinucleotide biosynthesis protein A